MTDLLSGLGSSFLGLYGVVHVYNTKGVKKGTGIEIWWFKTLPTNVTLSIVDETSKTRTRVVRL